MVQIPIEKMLSTTEFTELRVRPDSKGELSWIASTAKGSELRISDPSGNSLTTHILDIPIAAGRGTGGGAYDWTLDGSAIIYAAKDGSLVEYLIDARSLRVLWRGEGAPISGVSVLGQRAAVVVDTKVVTVIDFRTGEVHKVDDRADFAFDPGWTIRGLIWTAWNTPNMPWESSGIRMWNGMRSRWLVPPGDAQVQQARSIPGGMIGCVSDASGWLNVSTIKGLIRGRPKVLVPDSHEHANPTWGMGQRSWTHDGDSVFFARNENGFGRLVERDLKSGTESDLGKGVHYSLCCAHEYVAAIRTGARTPQQIAVYDKLTRSRTVIDSAADFSEYEESLVEPEVLHIGRMCVRRYAPPKPNGRHLVWVHGGPTDQAQVVWYPKYNYWLSRGYTVVVPDHRGTTGHGREYQQSLLGHWGEYDSNDIAAVIRHLNIPVTRVAVVGSSAGGMTALNVVADHPAVAGCAIVSYPVTDLAHLAETSHRFEKHSVKTLVGDQQLMRARSPLFKSTALRETPLLVMHGDADPVVPMSQSVALADAIRAAGGHIQFEVMPGEGHGFRSPENKEREYSLMETFLESMLRE